MEKHCEISGVLTLVAYSIFCVMSTGLFCLIMFSLVAIYKLGHLVASLLCPMTLSKLKKCYKGIPSSDFNHYTGQFDFEVDLRSEPDTHGSTKWRHD